MEGWVLATAHLLRVWTSILADHGQRLSALLLYMVGMHVNWDNAVWKCPAREHTSYKWEIFSLAEEHLTAWKRRVLFWVSQIWFNFSEESGWGDGHSKVALLALYISHLFLPDLLGADTQLLKELHLQMALTCKEVCRVLCKSPSTNQSAGIL